MSLHRACGISPFSLTVLIDLSVGRALASDRDVKPPNILIDPATGVLKIIDFGSAKQLVAGEPNVSYICSRYYRARECSTCPLRFFRFELS